MDEQRVIEPKALPEGARFNGYREYDVQDLIVKRHNIRLLLAEYVTSEGKTIAGEVPPEYLGHYGATLVSFVLYQHHQCRVPQPLILEELREFGIDITSGQVNRILIEHKELFHAEQQAVLSTGLETAEYVHTDDTLCASPRAECCGGKLPPANLLAEWLLHRDWQRLICPLQQYRQQKSGELSADFTWAASRLRAIASMPRGIYWRSNCPSATWPNCSFLRSAGLKLKPTGRDIFSAWALQVSKP